jgi:hypothetical protein
VRKAVALFFVLMALAAWPGGAMAARPVFTITGANCTEGTKCVFTITKDAKASSYSKIAFKAYGAPGLGNAHLGVDFVKTEVSITFGNTELTKKVEVQTINNGVVDGNRLLAAAIYNLRNATVAVPGTTGVYIVDDDSSTPLPPPTQTCPDGSVIPATDTCPVVPPATITCPDGTVVPVGTDCPTPPAPGYVLAPTLAGAAPIDSVFSTSSAIVAADIPPSENGLDVGAFRFICGPGQLLKDDPIVYPGQPGKSHWHQFFGNMDANASSTRESLRAGHHSTCNKPDVNAVNLSGYWMPAMFDGLGHIVQPNQTGIYYKRWPVSDPHCNSQGGYPTRFNVEGVACVGVPNALRFIFGYNMINPGQAPTGAVQSFCAEQLVNFETLTQAFNRCRAIAASTHGRTHLLQRIEAPSCWDGKYLDTPDHRSHVAYPSYGDWGYARCPSTHPYVFPTFTMTTEYTILPTDDTTLWHFSSDEMVAGAAPGTTYHADYFEGWDPTAKDMWTRLGCIDIGLNCNSGNMGNGYSLNGANAPWFLFGTVWERRMEIPDDRRLVTIP